MFFTLIDLQLKPIPFRERLAPGELDFGVQRWRQASDVEAEGEARLANEAVEEIRVSGRVKVAMETDCDRCLEAARFEVDESFRLVYLPQAYAPKGEEVAVRGDESEVDFYEGEGLELKPILQEQILLALPMHALCQPDCQGICAVCGTHRNVRSCDCETKPADDRWSALKNLRMEV